MSLLAEKKIKRKPRKLIAPSMEDFKWNSDDNIGSKILQNMGWSKGKGIGKNEGHSEPINPKFQLTTKGLGSTGQEWDAPECAYVPPEHYAILENALAKVNEKHKSSKKSDSNGHCEKKSLEKLSKSSRSRVHYGKFVKSKDISQLSEKDLNAVLGIKIETKKEVQVEENEPPSEEDIEQCEAKVKAEENQEQNASNYLADVLTVHQKSSKDYFKEKLKELKRKRNEGILGDSNPNETTDSFDTLPDLNFEPQKTDFSFNCSFSQTIESEKANQLSDECYINVMKKRMKKQLYDDEQENIEKESVYQPDHDTSSQSYLKKIKKKIAKFTSMSDLCDKKFEKTKIKDKHMDGGANLSEEIYNETVCEKERKKKNKKSKTDLSELSEEVEITDIVCEKKSKKHDKIKKSKTNLCNVISNEGISNETIDTEFKKKRKDKNKKYNDKLNKELSEDEPNNVTTETVCEKKRKKDKNKKSKNDLSGKLFKEEVNHETTVCEKIRKKNKSETEINGEVSNEATNENSSLVCEKKGKKVKNKKNRIDLNEEISKEEFINETDNSKGKEKKNENNKISGSKLNGVSKNKLQLNFIPEVSAAFTFSFPTNSEDKTNFTSNLTPVLDDSFQNKTTINFSVNEIFNECNLQSKQVESSNHANNNAENSKKSKNKKRKRQDSKIQSNNEDNQYNKEASNKPQLVLAGDTEDNFVLSDLTVKIKKKSKGLVDVGICEKLNGTDCFSDKKIDKNCDNDLNNLHYHDSSDMKSKKKIKHKDNSNMINDVLENSVIHYEDKLNDEIENTIPNDGNVLKKRKKRKYIEFDKGNLNNTSEIDSITKNKYKKAKSNKENPISNIDESFIREDGYEESIVHKKSKYFNNSTADISDFSMEIKYKSGENNDKLCTSTPCNANTLKKSQKKNLLHHFQPEINSNDDDVSNNSFVNKHKSNRINSNEDSNDEISSINSISRDGVTNNVLSKTEADSITKIKSQNLFNHLGNVKYKLAKLYKSLDSKGKQFSNTKSFQQLIESGDEFINICNLVKQTLLDESEVLQNGDSNKDNILVENVSNSNVKSEKSQQIGESTVGISPVENVFTLSLQSEKCVQNGETIRNNSLNNNSSTLDNNELKQKCSSKEESYTEKKFTLTDREKRGLLFYQLREAPERLRSIIDANFKGSNLSEIQGYIVNVSK